MTSALTPALTLYAVPGLPEIAPGDDLVPLILDCVGADWEWQDGDVLVLAQKIVSKAEGRFRAIADVTPSDRAHRIAAETDKDPAMVELVLRESSAVVRHRRGVLITRHRGGAVLANAGIDASNVPPGPDGADRVLLLPEDSDRSAAALRASLQTATGCRLAVVINDSPGRAWRRGSAGIAIGVSGLTPVADLKGRPDRDGRSLQASELAVADEVAAAASLVMGQGGEGQPAVIVRGLPTMHLSEAGSAADLIRDPEMDLFL